jgi:hypothetical protein
VDDDRDHEKMNDRSRIVLIVIGVIFIVIPIIGFIIYSLFFADTSRQQGTVEKYVDQDTGEVVESYSDLYGEQEEGAGVILLGLEPLANDMFYVQFNFIRDELGTYSTEKLGGRFSPIVVLPTGYSHEGRGNISGSLRLGEGDENIVPFEILALENGTTRLIVRDPDGKYGGEYDSGIKVFVAD